MAARHLQRLRAAVNEKVEEELSSSEEEVVSAKAPFNPFDLLSDEEVIMHFIGAVQTVVCVGLSASVIHYARPCSEVMLWCPTGRACC